ncbi:MAG: bifunctional nuclease family protein [Bacteroidales bacterium]|nr:bifunctional nuclease family protein [Bacteroidales bacterium]MCF8338252.1 bifunctional nuclease family protein [Bacteroidales bacterium]
MENIKLKIIGMSYSQAQTGAYALILGEENGERRIPIVIGGFEAQAIAIELEDMKPARPLTHDLFKNFAQTFHIQIKQIIINKFSEGIFYALLVCEDAAGNTYEIDSRTSDAVALAIRFDCPIYTYESIVQQTGVSMEEAESDEESYTSSSGTGQTAGRKEQKGKDEEFSSYTLNELEQMIKDAIAKEDYERASLIQREINARKNK